MQKFEFNLEKVLYLKVNNEDKAKVEFAKVMQKKNKFDQEIQNSLDTINRIENVTSSYMNSNTTSIDYNMIAKNDKYIESLKYNIKANEKNIELILPELKEKEGVLREAMREKKILERIKEKRYDEYLQECDYEEAEILDEVSSNIFLREWRNNA